MLDEKVTSLSSAHHRYTTFELTKTRLQEQLSISQDEESFYFHEEVLLFNALEWVGPEFQSKKTVNWLSTDKHSIQAFSRIKSIINWLAGSRTW